MTGRPDTAAARPAADPLAPAPGAGHAARLREVGALILTLAGTVLLLGGVVTTETAGVLAGCGVAAASVAHLLGGGPGTGARRPRATAGLRIVALLALVASLVTRLAA